MWTWGIFWYLDHLSCLSLTGCFSWWSHWISVQKSLGRLTKPRSAESKTTAEHPNAFSKYEISPLSCNTTFSHSIFLTGWGSWCFTCSENLQNSTNFRPSWPSLPGASGQTRLKSGQGGAEANMMIFSAFGSLFFTVCTRSGMSSCMKSPLWMAEGKCFLTTAMHSGSTSQQMCRKGGPIVSTMAWAAEPMPSKQLSRMTWSPEMGEGEDRGDNRIGGLALASGGSGVPAATVSGTPCCPYFWLDWDLHSLWGRSSDCHLLL